MELNDAEIEMEPENAPVYEDDLKNLKHLFSTSTGTYPMNRDFGIDTDIMDAPVFVAKTMLSVEYHNKVEQYMPHLEVTDVSFSANPDNGSITPHVRVARAEVEEEEKENFVDNIEEGEDDE